MPTDHLFPKGAATMRENVPLATWRGPQDSFSAAMELNKPIRIYS
jgi:hypothetical protein